MKNAEMDAMLRLLLESPGNTMDSGDIANAVKIEYEQFLTNRAFIIKRFPDWLKVIETSMAESFVKPFERATAIAPDAVREVSIFLENGGFEGEAQRELEKRMAEEKRKAEDEDTERRLAEASLSLTVKQIADWDASVLRSWWSLWVSIGALLIAIIAAIAAFK